MNKERTLLEKCTFSEVFSRMMSKWANTDKNVQMLFLSFSSSWSKKECNKRYTYIKCFYTLCIFIPCSAYAIIITLLKIYMFPQPNLWNHKVDIIRISFFLTRYLLFTNTSIRMKYIVVWAKIQTQVHYIPPGMQKVSTIPQPLAWGSCPVWAQSAAHTAVAHLH